METYCCQQTHIPLQVLVENCKSHKNDSKYMYIQIENREIHTRMCAGPCIWWPIFLPLNSLAVKRDDSTKLSDVTAKSLFK